MYAPPQFKPDRSACLAFAAARGFGLACAHDAAGPIASPLPFAIQYASAGTPLLSFHIARNNPLARCADARTPWLMAVTAGHAMCRRTGTHRRTRCRPGCIAACS